MNRNTLLAVVLIMAAMAFFVSPAWEKFWYTQILHQPVPTAQQQQQVPAAQTPESAAPTQPAAIQKPALAPAGLKVDTIWVRTKTMIVGISDLGARIVSLKMRDYTIRNLAKGQNAGTDTVGKGRVDLIQDSSEGGACLTINNTSFNNIMFAPETPITGNNLTVPDKGTATVSFLTKDPVTGTDLRKQFVFYSDGYKIGFKVLDDKLNDNKVMVSWPAGIKESELITGQFSGEERVAHWWGPGDDVQHLRTSNPEKLMPSGDFQWVGISSKYFFTAMVADTVHNADIQITAFKDTLGLSLNGKKDKSKRVNYSVSYQYTAQGNSAPFWFYAGPSELNLLEQYHLQFQKILFPVLGWTRYFFWADKWFPPIGQFILWMLIAVHKIVRDYGIAILILTVLTRLVTFPLTQSSIRSMNRMKDLQPKMNAIREKYKNNPTKLNQEVMALYKREGVNPLNPGCLPMFLQMPIFIALYVVLRKAIELRGAGTIIVPWVHDLSQPESIFYLGNIIPGGIPMYGSSIAVLPIIMAVVTYFQNKMTIKDPNQKMMIYFMPIFMLVLFNNFASGLVLYWTFSSLLQVIQQWYTTRNAAPATPASTGPAVRQKVSVARRK